MRPAILSLFLLSSIPAAELVVRDLRAGLDLLPVDFGYSLADSTGTRTGNDVFDQHYGLSVGARYSLARIGESHGAVVGVDLGMAQATYAPADGAISSYLVAGELGYAWALTDTWTLAGAGRLGLGLTRAQFDGSGSFASYAPQGPMAEYGARVGVLWSVTDQVVVDGHVGWRASVARLTADGRDLDLDTGGLLVSLGFAWRFTSSPWRLE